MIEVDAASLQQGCDLCKRASPLVDCVFACIAFVCITCDD